MNGEFLGYICFCLNDLNHYKTIKEIYDFIKDMASEISTDQVFIFISNNDTIDEDFVKKAFIFVLLIM